MPDYSLGGGHLSTKTKLAYGFGHILNDSCASMWFTYLLVYLQYVLRLNKGLSGLLLLLGQVADAVSTPLVGIQSDKGCGTSWCRYGRRKTWHAIGTICVLVSFPFIFILCTRCDFYWPDMYVLLLAFMIVLFQFGWASTQVSHLAMIPDLTPNEAERDELNIIRYFFDMSSDVLVYIIVWITFKSEQTEDESQRIDRGDYIKFKITTITILLIGATFSLLFHIFIPESSWQPTPEDQETVPVESTTNGNAEEEAVNQGPSLPSGTMGPDDLSLRIRMFWRDWLLEPQFYYVSLIYTCARLVANLSNIYMPIFLQETIHAKEELITIIPLVMSISGCAGSILLKIMRKCASKKASMVIAILTGLIASAISSMRPLNEYGIFLLAILFGLSGSIMIILSLAFTSDLIGYCTDSSAFVYGSMSFWDKLVNGLAVALIQGLTATGCFGDDCSAFYRRVMSLGIMFPLMVAVLGLFIISSTTLGKTKKIRRALRELAGSSGGTPVSSDSSEFLVATDSKMGYGAVTKI